MIPKNDNDPDVKAQSREAGIRVLFWISGFFLVFASVDAWFVYKAVTTNSGVVAENAYEIGVNYNDVIAEARQREHDGDADR